MKGLALPVELQPYSGELTDVDTHEMAPASEWERIYGPEVGSLADYITDRESRVSNAHNYAFEADDLAIDETIVNVKGNAAPGAVDLSRRLDVMDAMGIKSQLLYPTGLVVNAMNLYKDADDPSFMPAFTGDRRATAARWFEVYNEWTLAVAKLSDRIRPVGVLFGTTPAELIESARRLTAGGIRSVWLFPSGELPGGRSPAHPDLDPMWAILAEADCSVTLHVAGDGKFFATNGWRDAPAFEGFMQHLEISRDPWFLTGMHLAMENFLVVMLLGGVFERHPNLRFGVIEAGSYWVGPMIHRLDLWYSAGNAVKPNAHDEGQVRFNLEHPPSYYLKRNVRVTPFVFEDFVAQMEMYDLGDVLCFSTDYPHPEGGRSAAQTFVNTLAKYEGTDMLERFFVSNGALLLPD